MTSDGRPLGLAIVGMRCGAVPVAVGGVGAGGGGTDFRFCRERQGARLEPIRLEPDADDECTVLRCAVAAFGTGTGDRAQSARSSRVLRSIPWGESFGQGPRSRRISSSSVSTTATPASSRPGGSPRMNQAATASPASSRLASRRAKPLFT